MVVLLCQPWQSELVEESLPDASVDLVYLDPPFNSNASYNVLFKEASGEPSQAQFHAFPDTWEWTVDVDATYASFGNSLIPSQSIFLDPIAELYL